MAGYFFMPDSSGSRRPTVVLNNGSDGPVISQWSLGGRAAIARGWNAMTFDGPGQGAALHRQHLYFRHDWEKVVTPVVDYLLGRDDAAAEKIALQGVSQAGFWASRAAAFEHRIAALVADPGVVRVASSWEQHLPKEMVQLLDDDTIRSIRCPTLVLDPDHEQFWPGQSQQFYDTLTCQKH
jgi:hypothetical protein